MKLTAAAKLEWIRVAVYSVGDTITAAEALSLIAAFFAADPIVRLNQARLAELLAELDAKAPRSRRGAAETRRGARSRS